jgi:hypothetical protein
MLKLNRVSRNSLATIGILLLIISALAAFKTSTTTSGYTPITTKTVSDGSVFDLPVELECTAGSGKKGGPYAKGLTPGGVCGAQKLVTDQAGGYEITDGIGGSLI